MESEKKTEKYLKNEMLKLKGISFKFTCAIYRGVPDRICLFPDGTTVYVEVKSEGEKPEPHQIRMHGHMRERNALVYVIDTKAQVDKLINMYGPKEIICQTLQL